MSHPSWVRGLKLPRFVSLPCAAMSHPSWVRGLKPEVGEIRADLTVAPLVGAWIETFSVDGFMSSDYVAPLVGAWIETFFEYYKAHSSSVAPLVGAWIETP